MGRPKKPVEKKQFEKLCALQCTEAEICGFFGVCEDTLVKWCKETYDGKTFSDVYKTYAQDGKVSLRRMQWGLAKKSAAMAIFLGKNYLGQSDEPSLAQSEEAQRNAGEQTLALADLINHPAPDRTMDAVKDGETPESGTEGGGAP